jgi:hypothetical protein
MERIVSACALLATATLALGSPAKANWQYTEWGMTPAEVTAASDGLATANNDRSQDAGTRIAKLVAPYKAGRFHFDAFFNFEDPDGLVSISLVLKRPSRDACSGVIATLSNTYGPPANKTEVEIGEVQKWFDEANRNGVVYLGMGSEIQHYCLVQYMPLKSPGEPGGL